MLSSRKFYNIPKQPYILPYLFAGKTGANKYSCFDQIQETEKLTVIRLALSYRKHPYSRRKDVKQDSKEWNGGARQLANSIITKTYRSYRELYILAGPALFIYTCHAHRAEEFRISWRFHMTRWQEQIGYGHSTPYSWMLHLNAATDAILETKSTQNENFINYFTFERYSLQNRLFLAGDRPSNRQVITKETMWNVENPMK